MTQLNSAQRAAVHHIDSPLLVIAGAGSGKTSVITRKIAYLSNSCGIDSSKIFAVTFTNKAAKEMKSRTQQLIKGKNRSVISTFHHLGLTMLRYEHLAANLKPGFSIFDSSDSLNLLKELMRKNSRSDEEQVMATQKLISTWKNDFIAPEHALSHAQDDLEKVASLVYEQYNRHLRTFNAVDFDDLIYLPTMLLKTNLDIKNKWQNRVHYLLVDEYQDTNNSQYELVKLLVGVRQALTAVGDDDQSIYTWRGARPENLAKLNDDFSDLSIIKLEQNYRSTKRILKAANQVIGNNPHVFVKNLWSDLGLGESIRIISCQNEDAEAERIVTEIVSLRAQKRYQFGDFAVLYRGNHQSRLLEIKLQQYQVPYKVSGTTSFFERSEIKDLMGYLRLLINPDDDNAFLRIINVPRREIGPVTMEKLGSYANERGVSLLAACDELGLEAYLPARSIEKLRYFYTWISGIARLCYEGDGLQAINTLINEIDYQGWLQQTCTTPADAERRWANVQFLMDSLTKILSEEKENEEETNETALHAAIARLVLRDRLSQQNDDAETNEVQLMTLHAAKGLEFPHVFIAGLEEEILPHRTSIEENNIEEERRLFYVGITRAQQTLALTLTKKRNYFGQTIDCTPSRFLDELPEDDIEWEGREPSSTETKQRKGVQGLMGLKNLLNQT